MRVKVRSLMAALQFPLALDLGAVRSPCRAGHHGDQQQQRGGGEDEGGQDQPSVSGKPATVFRRCQVAQRLGSLKRQWSSKSAWLMPGIW